MGKGTYSLVNQTTSSAALDVLHHYILHCGGRRLVYETREGKCTPHARLPLKLYVKVYNTCEGAGETIKFYVHFDSFVTCSNATVNVLDRHVERHPDKTAIIWEKDEQGDYQTVTYK